MVGVCSVSSLFLHSFSLLIGNRQAGGVLTGRIALAGGQTASVCLKTSRWFTFEERIVVCDCVR